MRQSRHSPEESWDAQRQLTNLLSHHWQKKGTEKNGPTWPVSNSFLSKLFLQECVASFELIWLVEQYGHKNVGNALSVFCFELLLYLTLLF